MGTAVYVFLFIMLCVTPNGIKALSYLFRFFLRKRNRILVDQISMEIDSYKKGIVNRRKELVLKVKRFELPSSESTIVSSSYDNKSCSICSESSDKGSEMDEEILCPICMCEIND